MQVKKSEYCFKLAPDLHRLGHIKDDLLAGAGWNSRARMGEVAKSALLLKTAELMHASFEAQQPIGQTSRLH